MKEVFGKLRIPGNDPNDHSKSPDGKRYKNPVILNEYGWIWLNRNGTTTTLTDKVYENVFPDVSTPEQRLEVYAKHLGMLTEFWRAGRKAAAVMHFCGLGYSRPEPPRGQTSDHFIDLRELTFEPNFVKYLKPAFSPVGVMLGFWENSVARGSKTEVPVFVINDNYADYSGELVLSLSDGKAISRKVRVQTMGRDTLNIPLAMPVKDGSYVMQASLVVSGDTIRSTREFLVK